MDAEFINKLEQLINEAVRKRERAARTVEKALEDFNKASTNIRVYEKAMEICTEGASKPYRPRKLSTPNFLDTLQIKVDGFSSDSNPKKDLLTKMGVLRRVLRESNRPLTISQILEAMPEGLPFVITRDDLYKMLTKLVRNLEINKVDVGLYEHAK